VSGKKAARTPAEINRLRSEVVQTARRALKNAIAKGSPTKIENCRRELANAQLAATRAKQTPKRKKRRSGALAPKPRAPGNSPAGPPEVETGIRYFQDPDASTRTVWVFKTGTSFHRRDCHIVESRDGAVQIPVSIARQRNMARCMHCVPTVR
jgi:hypothetical protein